MRSSTSNSTIGLPEKEEFLSPPPPIHLQIGYFIGVWSFKAFTTLSLNTSRLFRRKRSGLLEPEIKSYPIRSDLKNRVFRPQGLEHLKLPLYLDIHGGGWAVADPETDDEFCSFLAHNFRMIVVSIDYHKSPRSKFPSAVDDVTALADAIIEDPFLNIDRKKVAIGGFSAGGNLAFAACQMNSLRGRLSCVLGFYPPLDLTESLKEKMGRRPKGSGSDLLASSANLLDWAYVPHGVDRRNPLLSPRWCDSQVLPPYAYLIGAEYDMLCYEACQMAESLAAAEFPRSKRTDIPALASEDGWQQGGIRWECVRGRKHAFTHIPENGRKERDRVSACNELYNRVGIWLHKDVWEKPLQQQSLSHFARDDGIHLLDS
jgi:acetyl esterase/lipase